MTSHQRAETTSTSQDKAKRSSWLTAQHEFVKFVYFVGGGNYTKNKDKNFEKQPYPVPASQSAIRRTKTVSGIYNSSSARRSQTLNYERPVRFQHDKNAITSNVPRRTHSLSGGQIFRTAASSPTGSIHVDKGKNFDAVKAKRDSDSDKGSNQQADDNSGRDTDQQEYTRDDVQLGKEPQQDYDSEQYWSQCFTDFVNEKLSGDQLILASASTAIKKPTGVFINISYDANREHVSPSVKVEFPDYEDDDDAKNKLLEADDSTTNSQDAARASGSQQPVASESDETDTVKIQNTDTRLMKLCCPPPIFMLLISALQVGMYFTQDSISSSGNTNFKNSQIVYDPCKRHQAWPRYLMYIFAHGDLQHLIGNVVVQVGLGFFQELVHKWRIPIIYLSSAVGGCLMHAVISDDIQTYGASGGVFGLMGARIAALVLDRKVKKLNTRYIERCCSQKTSYHVCKRTATGRIGSAIVVLVCCSYAIYDFVVIAVQYVNDINTTSFGAHLGGLIVGTLLGIITLKEHKNKRNRIVDYIRTAQDDEEYKKNPRCCKLICFILPKKKLKLAMVLLLIACVVAAICGNVVRVAVPTKNLTQCLQNEFANTNSSDPNSDGSVNKQPDEPKIDFDNTDHQVTKIVTPEPTERTVSTPGSGALFNRTSVVEFLLVPDMAAGYIYRLDTVTGRSIIVAQGEMRPTAVAYDPTVAKVFWTDVVANTLSSCHLDGSSKSVIYHFPYAPPSDGIAVSAQDKRVYYTNSGGPAVGFVSYDGSSARTLIRTRLTQPRAIALLPHQSYRLMFFTDLGNERQSSANIWRANMDTGNGMQSIVNTSIVWPNGLTVDSITNELFWCDAMTFNIEVADIDGRNRRVYVTVPLRHFFSIAVDSKWIYTTSWRRGLVTKYSRQATRVRNQLLVHFHPVSYQSFQQQGSIAIKYQ